MRLLLVTFLIVVFCSCRAQDKWHRTNLSHIQDSLLTQYHVMVQQMKSYYKSDSSNRSTKLQIDQELIKNHTGIGDFIFFLDESGKMSDVKLVNIEIKSLHTNRFYDWQTFIKKPLNNNYDVRQDVGIDIKEVQSLPDLDKKTKDIISAMLIKLYDSIDFYGTPELKKNRILYCSFSF